MFGYYYVSTISDSAREAVDLGARIQRYEAQPPVIIEDKALFAGKLAFAGFKASGQLLWRRMEDRVRRVDLMRRRMRKDLCAERCAEGPCAEAAEVAA
jgi:hypothetical protein